MRYRRATPSDADAIATLHAESWRTHYRGAYRDSFLDDDVFVDRIQVWQRRFSTPTDNQFVCVAEVDRRIVGFACAYGRADETWGTLLDNLHVDPRYQRQGIGARLFSEVTRWCRQYYPDCGLYLWVLAQNSDAQRFYRGLGGTDRGGELSIAPGGGQIHGRRYVWTQLTAFR